MKYCISLEIKIFLYKIYENIEGWYTQCEPKHTPVACVLIIINVTILHLSCQV